VNASLPPAREFVPIQMIRLDHGPENGFRIMYANAIEIRKNIKKGAQSRT
jgi:hypothetical protein